MRSNLLLCLVQPPLNHDFVRHVLGLAAIPQPHLQHLRAGRQDEDRYRLRQPLHDLQRSLHIDVQQQVFACRTRMVQR